MSGGCGGLAVFSWVLGRILRGLLLSLYVCGRVVVLLFGPFGYCLDGMGFGRCAFAIVFVSLMNSS